MKKGFTLVELLAVIAILAILVIIALPNVLGMFQNAKKNTFTTELQNIYKSATTQYVSDSMNRGAGTGATKLMYIRTKDESGNGTVSAGTKKELDLSGTETIEYYIEFDLAGHVVKYIATDGEFVFWFDGFNESAEETKALGDYSNMKELSIEDIGSSVKVYTIADEKGEHGYKITFTPVTADREGKCTSSIDIQAVPKGETTPISTSTNVDYVPRLKASKSLNSYASYSFE